MCGGNIISKATEFWKKSVTLEPVIIVYIFSNFILDGSKITTDLLIMKMCNTTNFENITNEEIDCSNTTWIAGQEQVMQDVNHFQMIQQWLRSGPSLVYILFVGDLVDRHGGMKLLSMLPIMGVFLSDIAELINYIFIESLPIEFFYAKDSLIGIFGGEPIFYIGVYGYGAAVSKPEDRPRRMARFDGCGRIGMLIGTILSPYMFDAISYYGCYCLAIALSGLVSAYLIFVVKEIPKPVDNLIYTTCDQIEKDQDQKCSEVTNKPNGKYVGDQPSGEIHQIQTTMPKYNINKSVTGNNDTDYTISESHIQSSCCIKILFFVRNYIGLPLYEMAKVPFKKREQNLRALLLIIMGTYGLYWFAFEEMLMRYNYLIQAFIDIGFDGKDMSWLSTIDNVFTIFGSVVVLPFILEKWKLQEPVVLFIILYLESLSMCISAFVPKLWQFYLSYCALGMMSFCKYSLTMSMVSKCIDKDELAKVFSAMGIMSAFMPMVGNPIYRILFDRTIEEFPRSVLILSSAIAFLNATCNVFLSTQRSKMKLHNISEGNDFDENASTTYKNNKRNEIMNNSTTTNV